MAGSTESHSYGHCPSHPLPPGGSNDQRAVPQAPRHYQSAKHRPPALVGSHSQRWGRVPWSGQWDAQEVCCTGFNAKYSQGEARPRRWPGRSFQHECAPASTSRPHKKAACPQSTDLRGSWRRHTHCRFLFSLFSKKEKKGKKGKREQRQQEQDIEMGNSLWATSVRRALPVRPSLWNIGRRMNERVAGSMVAARLHARWKQPRRRLEFATSWRRVSVRSSPHHIARLANPSVGLD